MCSGRYADGPTPVKAGVSRGRFLQGTWQVCRMCAGLDDELLWVFFWTAVKEQGKRCYPSADPRPRKIHEKKKNLYLRQVGAQRQEGSAARTPNTNATRLQAGSAGKRGHPGWHALLQEESAPKSCKNLLKLALKPCKNPLELDLKPLASFSVLRSGCPGSGSCPAVPW